MTMKATARETPDRDSKYMGLAWFYAAFSKDPNTQVGACIARVDGVENFVLGCGYNGPPREMNDDEVPWHRPPPDDPNAYSKYDVMVHAEVNAIDHVCGHGVLSGATLYVTAMPCSACMLRIAKKGIRRVVYTPFKSGEGSIMRNAAVFAKSEETARLSGVILEEFEGDLNWMADWVGKMTEWGIIGGRGRD